MRAFVSSRLSHFGFVIISLLIFLPFLGLPPARFGFFLQVEAIICGLWVLGGIAGIWSFLLFRDKPRLAAYLASMPAVVGTFGLALLSAVLSIFHILPLRDWTGSPQLAEGILTFLSITFLSFVAIPIFSLKQFHKPLLACTLLSALIISSLTIIGSPSTPFREFKFWIWAPVYFPDFLAFLLIGVAAIYVCLRNSLKRRLVWDAFMIVCMGIIAYYCASVTLNYGFIIALATAAGVYIFPVKNKKALGILALVGLSLGLTTFILYYDFFSQYLPQGLRNLSTLESRTYLAQVTILNLSQQPANPFLKQILCGNGWGSYVNSIVSNLFLLKNVSLFRGDTWKPTWEFINRDLVHSHNSITEYFNALGVLGALAFLFIKSLLVKGLRREYFWTGLIILVLFQSMALFWFQLPHTLPYTLIGMALISATPLRPILWLQSLLRKTTKVMPVLMVIWAGAHGLNVFLLDEVLALRTGRDLVKTMHDYLNCPKPFKAYDGYTGGQRLLGYMRAVTSESMQYITKYPTVDTLPLVESCLAVSHNLWHSVPSGGNVLCYIVPLNIYSEVSTHPQTRSYLPSHPETLNDWGKICDDLIEFFPARTDSLIPFLNILSEQGRMPECLYYGRKILDYAPQDPVGLWFSGMALLFAQGQHQQGIHMLQQALRLGIGKFMPISEAERHRLLMM